MISVYRFVDDKVVCLNNAINILTRLLETIFKVVGADELMDGICIIVMQAQVPRLKLQLQMIDYYYEGEESMQGIFESVKLRVRSMISFIKNCRFSDFCKLDLAVWEKYMGRNGEGLSQLRRNSELSSDDEISVRTPEELREEMDEKTQKEKEDALFTPASTDSQNFKTLFGKKTKKIVDGKWRDCLDPKPRWVDNTRMNDELVKEWKSQRYRYYKTKPANPEEEEILYDVVVLCPYDFRNTATSSVLLRIYYIWFELYVFVKKSEMEGKLVRPIK